MAARRASKGRRAKPSGASQRKGGRKASPRGRSASAKSRSQTSRKGGKNSARGNAARSGLWRFVWLPLAVGAAMLSFWAGLVFLYGNLADPGRGDYHVVVLEPGLSPEKACAKLQSAGLIEHPRLFQLYAGKGGKPGFYRAGSHFLPDDASPKALVKLIRRLPSRRKRHVYFPEGMDRYSMARRLHRAGICHKQSFLTATGHEPSLQALGIGAKTAEGYLFPAKYEFFANTEPSHVVKQLVKHYQERALRLSALVPLKGKATRKVLTPHQQLTLASMVEKEAMKDDERPIIAAVFYNRFLDKTFRPKPPYLQSDPTAGYGCKVYGARLEKCAGYTGKITRTIIHDKANPYSTYTHKGLPPGPICNPGEASLRAVRQPADVDYLYFVAKGGGRHHFSRTLKEHRRATH